MFQKTMVLLLVAALLALPGCQMNERLSGTLLGAAGGALVGGLASPSVVGVLAGGLAGGVAGYLVGDYLADRRERCQAPCDPCAPPPSAAPCPSPCPTPSAYRGAWSSAGEVERDAVPATQAVDYRLALDASRAASRDLVEQGRHARTAPEALHCYEEALHLDPANAEAWNQIGLQRVMAGEPAAGRAAFERALAIDPSHVGARRNLAWARGR